MSYTEDLVADATPQPHGLPFDWGGRTWRLKPHLDVRVQARLQREDLVGALVLIMGKDQAAELIDYDDTDDVFDTATIVAMLEKVAKASGVTMGESPASPS